MLIYVSYQNSIFHMIRLFPKKNVNFNITEYMNIYFSQAGGNTIPPPSIPLFPEINHSKPRLNIIK